MATTKKQYDPNDFTNQEQAMSKADVDSQDSKTRLWQSMNYTYGKQRDDIAKNYDKAISQQDNAMLARGMQRSSYGAQIRSGLMNDSIEAQNDNYAAQIADYQSRIGQLEQQEKEDERWERQYADQRADTAWNQGFQQSQFDWQKGQADQQMAYQRERDAVSDAFNEKQFQAQREDTAWNQSFQQGQFDYQKDQAAQQFAYQQGRDAIEDAFRNKQFETQVNQWKQEFDYNKMSNDQKIAFDILTAAVAADKDADDATLARAGISRAEYNSMRKAKSNGGGRKKPTEEEGKNPEKVTDDTFMNDLDEFGIGEANDWQNEYLINRQNKWDRNGGTLNR